MTIWNAQLDADAVMKCIWWNVRMHYEYGKFVSTTTKDYTLQKNEILQVFNRILTLATAMFALNMHKFFFTNYKSWTPFLLSVEILFYFLWQLPPHRSLKSALRYVHIYMYKFFSLFRWFFSLIRFYSLGKNCENLKKICFAEAYIKNESAMKLFKVLHKIFNGGDDNDDNEQQ